MRLGRTLSWVPGAVGGQGGLTALIRSLTRRSAGLRRLRTLLTRRCAPGSLRLGGLALCLGLASCTIPGRAVVRNATGADILLWPLSERPLALKAGETTDPIVYTARERQQALIERGHCLYTYPAPDYFQLPKGTKGYASRIVVVIHEDMTLHAHQRSKKGAEGPEILVAGFPLKPTTFCGRRGEG